MWSKFIIFGKTFLTLLSANPHYMVKHPQTLFECIWPFYGVDAERVKKQKTLILNFQKISYRKSNNVQIKTNLKITTSLREQKEQIRQQLLGINTTILQSIWQKSPRNEKRKDVLYIMENLVNHFLQSYSKILIILKFFRKPHAHAEIFLLFSFSQMNHSLKYISYWIKNNRILRLIYTDLNCYINLTFLPYCEIPGFHNLLKK